MIDEVSTLTKNLVTSVYEEVNSVSVEDKEKTFWRIYVKKVKEVDKKYQGFLFQEKNSIIEHYENGDINRLFWTKCLKPKYLAFEEELKETNVPAILEGEKIQSNIKNKYNHN